MKNDRNLFLFVQMYMLDEDGQPMHSMMALYWKAGEQVQTREKKFIIHQFFDRTVHETVTSGKSQEDEYRSTTSNESSPTKHVSLTKVVVINEKDPIIFARYNAYIMLPSFTISNILNELDEEKIKILVKFDVRRYSQQFFSLFLRRINLVLNQFLLILFQIRYFVRNY